MTPPLTPSSTPSPTGLSGRTARRLDGVGSTIFAEMSALAVRTGSVNLGQGFPDVSGPAAAVEVAYDAMRAGRNQYPPGHGSPDLVAAVVRHQRRHYGIELTPEEVVVTTGATEAVAAAVLGLVDPGDEVVVLEPYYDSYRAMVQFAGGVRRPVTLRAPDYRLDAAELEAAVTPRTKLVLLNTPHNPTGHVLSRAELEAVADVARRHDLLVVTDEVYEHLVFDDHRHVPIATLPGMAERTVSISSSGKTFSFTGWKIGWATGPAALVAAVEGAKNWLSYSSGAPFQPAVAHALDHEEDFHRALRDDLATKRDHLCAGLADLGLEVHVPQGTYFTTTDVSALGWEDGEAFCLALPERAGVVAIPSQAFYEAGSAEGRHLVRWAFCKERDVIDQGLRRLRAGRLQA
ncbi:pyridoxal phosphate-dependent aminotransferase [Nocardioides aurantiacus]|uniref:N-succinyldiaminopimelate aminotransferase n=1 Tax=Nocardioides aurantiacus TaxID=86796 RepID=A0A3N2CYY6_9ACTN|nr:pyridoxal phosphate-dependent aminotransferase [Nocardioides aurantiacus]ROR92673.1 N-succinyldiaminopimelate aminotransferase [Nocardioides aurantiacus]